MNDKRTRMFHDGHRELQDRFDGRRMADALERNLCVEQFGDDDIRFIEESEFFFLATAYGKSVDCSFKGGPSGFVKVTGPQSLQWQDYDGNSMYRSLGNILKSPHVGILFIRFGDKPKRLRVNGHCSLIGGDTQSETKLIVEVEATEIFPNCPRYIPDLSTNAPSRFLPDESGASVKPAWKSFDDFKDYLPEHDPHRDLP